MKRAIAIAALALALQAVCLAQTESTCADLDRMIKTTYNFKPSKLTESERNSKSEAMDRFWTAVKANSAQFIPCLRAALRDSSSDKWFRFDASNLLVEIDPSRDSTVIQLRSYADADLDDLDLRVWATVVTQLGLEGLDTSEAAARWLAYPEARYFLPEHAYEVNAFAGALFIFGSMDEAYATPVLSRIASQSDHPGREIALSLLMLQATPESLRALKQVNLNGLSQETQSVLKKFLSAPDLLKPRPQPKTSREEFIRAFQDFVNGEPKRFMDLTQKVPDGEKDVVAVLKPEDLPLVRRVRRMMIGRGNQHAIGYYKDFTAILMTLVWKPELVK